MTNKELQELLKQHPDDAQIVSITIGNRNGWEYTPNPKVEYQENSFGKKSLFDKTKFRIYYRIYSEVTDKRRMIY